MIILCLYFFKYYFLSDKLTAAVIALPLFTVNRAVRNFLSRVEVSTVFLTAKNSTLIVREISEAASKQIS